MLGHSRKWTVQIKSSKNEEKYIHAFTRMCMSKHDASLFLILFPYLFSSDYESAVWRFITAVTVIRQC